MARFDLDLLHAFVTVTDTGSLTAAAPRLCRSQSAVSEQIRKLEETCGTALFLRSKAGTQLTAAGERLLGHARRILALNDTAFQDMKGLRLAGEVRFAITDYFEPATIATTLKKIRLTYPDLRLHVAVVSSSVIETAPGDVDIGLFMRIPEANSPDAPIGRPVRSETLRWVADETFARPGNAPLPVIALRGSCRLRQHVVEQLTAHEIAFDLAHSASGIAGAQLALSAGLGVTCLNASAVPPGAVAVGEKFGLPAMRDVDFFLTPPKTGEAAFVTDVRNILAEQLQ
ncbi:LysR family transcriptional regulator [Rhizobium sp. PAMB 3174]